MGNIVLLDDLTINKIAAGEVIERPASVVKELVENSIDAGAKNISIEIKNGGIGKIKISDDGCGIAEDDMEIAFERHATSKIRSAADLQKVMTMGFRGEALASIAAVSQVELISKRDDDSVGHRIVVEGGKTIEFKEAIRSRGTTITVQNLFYNTPVRYKFLKKDYTEAGYIEDTVTRIALVNKDVAIQLISNGKVILNTNGSGDLNRIIYSVYGKDIVNETKDVDYTYENIHVTGVVGSPNIARGNRANQLFFLNGRYIKNKNLTAAADQGFKDIVPAGRFGFLILNMEMDASMVDVNVHPAKLEVRFQDDNAAFKSIYNAIKSAFVHEDNTKNNNEISNYSDVAKKIDSTIELSKDNTLIQEVAKPISPEVPDFAGTFISKPENKKVDKKAKKGFFSKNKKDEIDVFENNPLADIYKTRKEQMQTSDETDMLKVNINNILKEEENVASAPSPAITSSHYEKADTIEQPIPKIVEIKTENEEDKSQDTVEIVNGAPEVKETIKTTPSREEKLSNQEKIAKFISDYHNRARHYNAEKLLKGIDEIVDKSGNVIETTEEDTAKTEPQEVRIENKTQEKVSDDTTEFVNKDRILEKVSTIKLDAGEVNELVKNMAQEEKNIKAQETQVININNNNDEEVAEEHSTNVDLKRDEDDLAETVENTAKETKVEEKKEETENVVENNVESGDASPITESTENSNENDVDDEIDIDNPYAIHINDIDDSEKGNADLEEQVDNQQVISSNHDTAPAPIIEEKNEEVESPEIIENDNAESDTEKVKNRIFAKAKDEIEKFTSFASSLLSSKIDSQNTELIDTKKVREAIDKNKVTAPANNSKEDFPGFAEMYKKTFGVEPFSIRKERKIKELEKEKFNASSEFSYATENVTMFENDDEENEEANEIQYKFIGQAFGNYVVIELKSEMYVIDVSACKRRLIYEDLKEKYYNDEEEGQMLLLPDVIILSKKELKLAQENTEMFEKAGFKFENFGENTIKLITVPSVCEELNTKQLFVEILDNLDTVAIIDTREKEEKFLSIIALKIASNEILDVDEEQVQKMLTKLLKYENPFTSPDGKPIAIKMTKNDLDKKFSRR
ncbi:MAG: DNA mismatch repair endonuclease MutL [Clostridia bacterium]|nr:DNA mismatch repair endonuclease MutL [Clostridia bacterium]